MLLSVIFSKKPLRIGCEPQTYCRSSLLSLKLESKKPDVLAGYLKEDFFNFLHKQYLSTLLNLQLTFITFAASHSQTEKLKLNMGEDYTIYAKQNEPVRSHDFRLKLLIQYYLQCQCPKSKNSKRKKKQGGIDYDVTGTKFLKTVSTALEKFFEMTFMFLFKSHYRLVQNV